MKKSLLISISKEDKFISWLSNESQVLITGHKSMKQAEEWIECHLIEMRLRSNFGLFNNCSIEIVNRILRAEEII